MLFSDVAKAHEMMGKLKEIQEIVEFLESRQNCLVCILDPDGAIPNMSVPLSVADVRNILTTRVSTILSDLRGMGVWPDPSQNLMETTMENIVS